MIWPSDTPLLCRSVPASALTPQDALDRLAGFSADMHAAVVLDERDRVAAATDEDEARVARLRELVLELFERAGEASEGRVGQVEVATADGAVFALRGSDTGAGSRWTIAAIAGRLALPSLMFYDLSMTLSDLRQVAV